jgi:hypothetical protein
MKSSTHEMRNPCRGSASHRGDLAAAGDYRSSGSAVAVAFVPAAQITPLALV